MCVTVFAFFTYLLTYPRRYIAGQTGVETAIATARPFLGVRASSLGLQKALGALYNFAAGCQVVGCKPGPQPGDEVGNHRGTWRKASEG